MSDLGFDDMGDDEMLDPHFEKPSLDALNKLVERIEAVFVGQQEIVVVLRQIAALMAADRESVAIGHDGRELKARSRIVNGR